MLGLGYRSCCSRSEGVAGHLGSDLQLCIQGGLNTHLAAACVQWHYVTHNLTRENLSEFVQLLPCRNDIYNGQKT